MIIDAATQSASLKERKQTETDKGDVDHVRRLRDVEFEGFKTGENRHHDRDESTEKKKRYNDY